MDGFEPSMQCSASEQRVQAGERRSQVGERRVPGGERRGQGGERRGQGLSNQGPMGFAITEMQRSTSKLEQDLSAVRNDVKEMARKQEEIAATIENISIRARRLGEPHPDDIICAECKTKRNSVKLKLPHLKEAFEDTNFVVPNVQITCILTTLCFALQAPSCRWMVTPRLLNAWADESDILMGASGFSILAFAIRGNARKRCFSSGPGRLYSLQMKEATIRAIRFARETGEVFEKIGGDGEMPPPRNPPTGSAGRLVAEKRLLPMPTWLIAMHPPGSVRTTVNAVTHLIEFGEPAGPSVRAQSSSEASAGAHDNSSVNSASNFGAQGAHGTATSTARRGAGTSTAASRGGLGTPSSSSGHSAGDMRATKRMRMAEGVRELGASDRDGRRNGNDGNGGDFRDKELFLYEEYRKAVVRKIRESWNVYQNRYRCDMRAFLHLRLLFLAEIIQDDFLKKGKTLRDAEMEGYKYVISEPGVDELPDAAAGWDVPTAKFGKEEECRALQIGTVLGPAHNAAEINMLERSFPSLTVMLRYKRKVLGAPEDALDKHPRLVRAIGGDIVCDVEEKISLHWLALDMLVDRFKVRDFQALLGMSGLSIRTVHILAIALRGLIRKAIGLELEGLENIALGNVDHRNVGTVEDVVTTKLEPARQSCSGKQAVTRKKQLTQKVEITYSDFLKEEAPSAVFTATGSLAAPPHTMQRGATGSARDCDPDWITGV